MYQLSKFITNHALHRWFNCKTHDFTLFNVFFRLRNLVWSCYLRSPSIQFYFISRPFFHILNFIWITVTYKHVICKWSNYSSLAVCNERTGGIL